MKKSIYKAIQNQLVIDGNSDIQYAKSDIDSRHTDYLTLNDLREVFCNAFTGCCYFTKKKLIEVFRKCNTSKCLLLITDDGNEISLHEYNENVNPAFIKFFIHNLTLIIPCYPSAIRHKVWESDMRLINKEISRHEIKYDIDGISNTQTLLNICDSANQNQPLPNKINIPAAKYCNDIQKTLLNGDVYQGYLPAIGELTALFEYADILYIVRRITPLKDIEISSLALWSSSEFNFAQTWYTWQDDNSIDAKTESKSVMPFFYKK